MLVATLHAWVTLSCNNTRLGKSVSKSWFAKWLIFTAIAIDSLTSWNTIIPPMILPSISLIGAAESSTLYTRPSSPVNWLFNAIATIRCSFKATDIGLTSVLLDVASTSFITSSIWRPFASSACQPVNRSAIGFIKLIIALLSVAITASPIELSITRKRSDSFDNSFFVWVIEVMSERVRMTPTTSRSFILKFTCALTYSILLRGLANWIFKTSCSMPLVKQRWKASYNSSGNTSLAKQPNICSLLFENQWLVSSLLKRFSSVFDQ